MDDAVDRLEGARRRKRRGRQQADGQVGPRAAEAQRVEAAAVEAARRRRRARPARSRHAAIGSSSSRRQTWRSCSHEPPERRVGSEVGMHEPRPGRASGTGTAVQFVVRSLTTCAGLLERRQLVAAGAGGIEVVEQRRGRRAGEADRARSAGARARAAARRTTSGTKSRCSSRACSMRARLTCRSKYVDVDEARAVAVGARRERAHHLLLAELGADRDDLARLDVGGEADDEVGEALPGGGVEPAAPLIRLADVVDERERPVDARDDEDPLDRAPGLRAHDPQRPALATPRARWRRRGRVRRSSP